jgi:hypothetical protein
MYNWVSYRGSVKSNRSAMGVRLGQGSQEQCRFVDLKNLHSNNNKREKGKARRAHAGAGVNDSSSIGLPLLPFAHSKSPLYPTDLSLACPVVLGSKELLGSGSLWANVQYEVQGPLIVSARQFAILTLLLESCYN